MVAWFGQASAGRERFNGFWPPEMGFCMEMIPMLKRHGYQYVLVDSIFIKPKREMRWEELRYRPYLARHEGAEIIVVPRDRDLSNAQLSGLDPGWFEHEVRERTKWCNFPALVTTWTDGENGGWFRATQIESGFWGFFYRPVLDRYRAGTLGFAPIHISEYLRRFPPTEEVEVYRGPGIPSIIGVGTSLNGPARCSRRKAGMSSATPANITGNRSNGSISN